MKTTAIKELHLTTVMWWQSDMWSSSVDFVRNLKRLNQSITKSALLKQESEVIHINTIDAPSSNTALVYIPLK